MTEGRDEKRGGAAEAFSTDFDWKLGQSDSLTAVGIWVVIGVIAASGMMPMVVAIGVVPELLGSKATRPLMPIGEALGPTLLFASLTIALVRYFSPAPRGWWGRSCNELAKRLPSERGRLRAAFEILPGLRWRGWHAAIVLLAPYRVVIVSRAYRRWVFVACFALVALLIAFGRPPELLQPSFVLSLFLFLATAGRRAAFDQIPYAEIEEVSHEGREVTLSIAHGRLAPAAVIETAKEPAAEHLAQRLDAIITAVNQGGEAADDEFVTRALQRIEATHDAG